MFQSVNPQENAYTNNSVVVFHNDKTSTNKELVEYIKTTYGYDIPNNTYKTIIVNKNVFRFIFHINLFVIVPEIFVDDNPTLVVLNIIDYLSSLIRVQNLNYDIANKVGYKLYLYYGDNIPMPFGFIKENLYEQDFFGNAILHKIRLYIRNFQYTPENKLTFTTDITSDTNTFLSKLVQEYKQYGKSPVQNDISFSTQSQPSQQSFSSLPSTSLPQSFNTPSNQSFSTSSNQSNPSPFTTSSAPSNQFTAPSAPQSFSAPSQQSFTTPSTSSAPPQSFSTPATQSNPSPFKYTSVSFGNGSNPFLSNGMNKFPNTFGSK
jgi:hypothetical protein